VAPLDAHRQRAQVWLKRFEVLRPVAGVSDSQKSLLRNLRGLEALPLKESQGPVSN
jgi:hypothetical protein